MILGFAFIIFTFVQLWFPVSLVCFDVVALIRLSS